MSQPNAERVCKEIYAETKVFYSELRERTRLDCGYEVLLSPPLFRPKILFIGFQPHPGQMSSEEARDRGYECGPPNRMLYATEHWPLAKVTRQMFGEKFLMQCTATNLVYLRAPSVDDYKMTFRHHVKQILQFCNRQTMKLADALEPKLILFVGLGTMEMVVPTGRKLVQSSYERRLLEEGQYGMHKAVSCIHLSGARPKPSRGEKDFIANHIGEMLAA